MSSGVPIYEARVINDRFTIYSQIGQRSQTWSQVTPGKPVIIPLPEQANLESVVVFQQNKQRNIQAIRHTLVTNTDGQVSDGFSGHLVVEVHKDNDRYRGVLLDVGVGNVVIWGTKNDCGHQEVLQIKDYKLIVISASSDKFEEKRTPLRYLKLTPITDGPLTVNYLLDGLRWEAHHTVVMDTNLSNEEGLEEGRVVFWRLGGTIYNRTKIPFIATEAVLMAGAINEPISQQKNVPQHQLMAVRAASYEDAGGFTGVDNEALAVSVEDFVAFRLQETPLRIDSLDRSGLPGITNVEVMSYGGFNVRKLYRCSIAAERYHGNGGNNGLPAEVLYRFDAGMFIPAGQAILYQYEEDQSRLGPLIGAVQIREAQPQDEVDLLLGRSTKVRCETVISRDVRLVPVEQRTVRRPQRSRNGSVMSLQVEEIDPVAETVVIKANGEANVPYYRHVKVSFTTQIINRNPQPVVLILTYPKGDEPVEKVDCQVPHVVKSDRLEWMVRVDPTVNKPSQFACSFVIREGPFYN